MDIDFACKQINEELSGGTIKGAVVSEDGETFGFRISRPGEEDVLVWVDCDPEGNRPGHLAIMKEKKDNVIQFTQKEKTNEID